MKRRITPYIYSLILGSSLASLSAQEMTLKLIPKNDQHSSILNSLKFNEKHKSFSTINNSLDSVKNNLKKIGFINVQVDSTHLKSNQYNAYINLGPSIKKVILSFEESIISSADLTRLGLKPYQGQIEIPFSSIAPKLKEIVQYYDLKGQSFVQVNLEDLQFKAPNLFAKLNIKLQKPRIIDKIIIEGYPQFSKKYLSNYLSLEQGDIFSNHLLQKLSNQINNLQFIEATKAPAVLFTKDSTLLYLYLKKVNLNQFDGLIGFNSKENGKGLRFNGYLDLVLTNLFHGGESFKVNWKNNGQERQQFDLQLSFPYVFGTKFNPSYTLNIYRQDSSFVNSSSLFELSYALKPQHKLGLLLKNENSSGIKELEPLSNYQSLFYGITYRYNQFYDHPLYKDKLSIHIAGLTGQRKVDFSTQQSQVSFDLNYLWKLKKLHHIYIANQNRLLFSDNYLNNELFRIGGANSIRGFSEDQFLAHRYNFLNLEYRFQPNSTSYVYSITDFGNFKNQLDTSSKNIYGFGLGYAFLSKIGLINMSYAIGGVSKQALNLGNSRFHLKIATFF